MMERKTTEGRLVAMQLTTDEGAFICNMAESDVAKVAAKAPGTYVIVYCAIRLDGMFGGRYEMYRTKTIEASSIDFYQSFHKSSGSLHTKKERLSGKGRKANDD